MKIEPKDPLKAHMRREHARRVGVNAALAKNPAPEQRIEILRQSRLDEGRFVTRLQELARVPRATPELGQPSVADVLRKRETQIRHGEEIGR